MDQVLITGAAGFLGRHLVELLRTTHRVVGIDLAPSPWREDVEWRVVGDDRADLAGALVAEDRGVVVHAAFLNKKPGDWSDERYLSTQMASDLELFRRCAELGLGVVLISSSAVYGSGGGAPSLDEDAPRRPVSVYGVSKSLQEMLAEQTAAGHGLELSIARLFNLVGPGQGPGLIVPDWVQQISAIADGAEPLLRVRTLETSRDFVDVRDAARAVGLIVRSFTPGEVFNVASGEPLSLRELAAFLQGLCPVPYEIVETFEAPGAANALSQRGDSAKLRAAHGWQPEFDWRRSVREFWEHYRAS